MNSQFYQYRNISDETDESDRFWHDGVEFIEYYTISKYQKQKTKFMQKKLTFRKLTIDDLIYSWVS